MSLPWIFSTRIPLERAKGSIRTAVLPPRMEVVSYGIHGKIAEHYGHRPDLPEAEASPLDHFIAAVGAALIGGLGRNLSRLGLDCDEGRLSGSATGHFADDGVLHVESMDVDFTLRAQRIDDPAAVENAFRIHVPECPITRTLGSGFNLRVSLTVEEESGSTTVYREGAARADG